MSSVFLIALAILQIPLHLASCIPPLVLVLDTLDGGRKSHNILFDESVTILDQVQDLVVEHNLSVTSEVKVLKAMLKHAAAFSAVRAIENGEVFLQLEGKPMAVEKINSIDKALDMLSSDAFPIRVWSTVSSPPFQIVLSGEAEFMSKQISGPESIWMYNQVKLLLSSARSKYAQTGVVIDVGANLGMVALFAAAMGEDVLAFEATSKTAKRLKASCIINGWCRHNQNVSYTNSFSNNSRFAIFENAVSNINGEDIVMRVDWHSVDNITNGGANSMFTVEEESNTAYQLETVKSITIDTALTSLGLLPEGGTDPAIFKPTKLISLLKLDCEGCEPLALLGSERLFKYNPPHAMMVEVNGARLYAGGVEPLSFMDQLEQLGYELHNQADGSKLSPIADRQDILKHHMQSRDVKFTSFMMDIVALRHRYES